MPAFWRITKGAGQIADVRDGNADDFGAFVALRIGNSNFVGKNMQSRYPVVEMKTAALLPEFHPVIPVILISVGYLRSISLMIPSILVVRISDTFTVCSSLSTAIVSSIPRSKLESVG